MAAEGFIPTSEHPQHGDQLEVPAKNAQSVSFLRALQFWFILGWISFGSPLAQLALMQHELVVKRRWISPVRFNHALNFCMILPGPEAQQLATYIGWLMHGVKGALFAGILIILPSLAITMLLAGLYVHYGQMVEIQALLYGLKPAVLAIVLAATVRLANRALVERVWIAIAIGAFLLLQLGGSFVFTLALAGLIGWLMFLFTTQPASHSPSSRLQAALSRVLIAKPGASKLGAPSPLQAMGPRDHGYCVSDDTPPPQRGHYSRNQIGITVGIAVALFSTFYGAILVYFPGILSDMAGFFLKASLLTFSGAYSVMPYLFDTMVTEKQWLTTGQLIDSIALAEVTPGPLAIVNVFLGFIAAAQHTSLTAFPIIVAGSLGALVVAVATFFPSFVFIMAGGPVIEATRKIPSWSLPLHAISAAVVAIMADLSLIFSRYILWPTPTGEWGSIGTLDLVAGLIAGLAIILMLQFRMGMIITMLICISLGVVASALGLP
ncbi:MAG: chromate transporter [Burkholderiaceae bacterium]